jgi:hypothetical protein
MSLLDTLLGRPSRKMLADALAADVDYLDVATALRDTAEAELVDAQTRAAAYGAALMLTHGLADGDLDDVVNTYALAVDAQIYLTTGTAAESTPLSHLRWGVLELEEIALGECEDAVENALDAVETARSRVEELEPSGV